MRKPYPDTGNCVRRLSGLRTKLSQRHFRFEHIRVPLPVRRSAGTFAVIAGSDPHTATVTVRTSFEPVDPTGTDQLSGIVHGAFQQSLQSLRRFVEDEIPWDAS